MKKILLWSGIILLLAAVLFSARKYFFKPVVFGEIKSVRALNMNLSDLQMELTFEVDNPNFFPVTITDFAFDVWLNDSYIGTVEPMETFKLPANTEGLVRVLVRTEYKGNIFEGFLLALETFDQPETKYRADGYVSVEALKHKRSIEIKKIGVAKMIQPSDTIKY